MVDEKLFRRNISGEIHVSAGAKFPEGGADFFIGGHPTEAQIINSPNLKAVIIPWAGLPDGTRVLMRGFPNIPVHNLHHNAANTAEMAATLLLAASRKLVPLDQELRRGDWTSRYERVRSFLLEGKTAVILGFGKIGQHLGRGLKGFGMTVLGIRRDPSLPTLIGSHDGVYPLETLFDKLALAEVLAITLPGTEATLGLIGEKAIRSMPPGSILINVGRGPIVDENALYLALTDGHLRAAGLDVWWQYPPDEASRKNTYPSQKPFHLLDNVVFSPHRGGSVDEVETQRLAALARLINIALEGGPIPNRVDLESGY